ncbi:MAG: dipeptide epimerase [Chitinophagaceae bacterium]|nr:dipeptide epimerase [Chitinophagaceae bacterium]
MKLRYWPYDLPFVYPFTISRGTKTHQPTLIVELEHMGIKGYGEAPAIPYYNITVEKMIADIEAKRQFIEKYAFTEPERYWHYLHHLIPQDNFLVCALDIAAWDIYGKMRNQPLYKLWGSDPQTSPLTDYTIGIDTLGNMLRKIDENPWPIYKIKLGTPEDIRIIRAIREKTSARIRVDANAGWSLDDARKLIVQLKELDIELIEQPLPADKWDEMKELYSISNIPLIADESCATENDVEKCRNYFHGINIKLTKCGGITPARRMIASAKKLGLQVMIGCMNETSIGSAAIIHLLPGIDYADADGPKLLAQDVATGLNYNEGRVKMSEKPGLGIEFHPLS